MIVEYIEACKLVSIDNLFTISEIGCNYLLQFGLTFSFQVSFLSLYILIVNIVIMLKFVHGCVRINASINPAHSCHPILRISARYIDLAIY